MCLDIIVNIQVTSSHPEFEYNEIKLLAGLKFEQFHRTLEINLWFLQGVPFVNNYGNIYSMRKIGYFWKPETCTAKFDRVSQIEKIRLTFSHQ